MTGTGRREGRRTRRTGWQRIQQQLDWPHPGGILLALAGAALVLAGAIAVGDPGPRTTPAPDAAASSPSAGVTGTASATSPAPADATTTAGPSPASSATATAEPPVAGAAADSPIQSLFAAPRVAGTSPALLNIANPASFLVLVNKAHSLIPLGYTPPDLVTPQAATGSGEPARLRRDAAAAVERMFAAAARDGVQLRIMSSFRSYATQVTLYESYVARYGRVRADTASARPGFSEHQTGLALDIGDAAAPASCDFTACFAGTAAAQWVAAHGAAYGFVVRYQNGFHAQTGYAAEPWHLRFLGRVVARDMTARGFHTYEQYLDVPGAPRY
ncbi:D-alanyl-D-alanine carboxypeptidase family protein [Specibacter sp. RAF43]|uniref:M15 family metallopeptidase n=1 Tax=Specibacter sp. RAF43 TaxID=3233057 RepID=UPI003F9D74F9